MDRSIALAFALLPLSSQPAREIVRGGVLSYHPAEVTMYIYICVYDASSLAGNPLRDPENPRHPFFLCAAALFPVLTIGTSNSAVPAWPDCPVGPGCGRYFSSPCFFVVFVAREISKCPERLREIIPGISLVRTKRYIFKCMQEPIAPVV